MAAETTDLTITYTATPFEGLPSQIGQYTGIPIRAISARANQFVTLVTDGNYLIINAQGNLPSSGAYKLVDLSFSVGSQINAFDSVMPFRMFDDANDGSHYIACNSWGNTIIHPGANGLIWTPERLPSYPIRGGLFDSDYIGTMTSSTNVTTAPIQVTFFARWLEYDQIQFDGWQVQTPNFVSR